MHGRTLHKAIATDSTPPQQELDQILFLQREVIELIGQDSPTNATLEKICSFIETLVGDCIVSVMTLDDERQHLNVRCLPSIAEEHWDGLGGLTPGPIGASCGTAVYLGSPVVVEDTQADQRWADYQDFAADYGIRACWSFPIYITADSIIGSIAISSNSPRAATPFHLNLLDTAAHLAGIALHREQVWDELTKTQARLSQITNTLPGAVFQLCSHDQTLDTDISFLSSGIETMLGLDAVAVIEAPELLKQQIQPADLDRLKLVLRLAAKNNEPWQCEFRARHINGEELSLHASARPVYHQSDKLYWSGILQDKTAENSRNEQLKLAGIVFASTNEGIMLCDDRQSIVDVNPAFCRLTGYSREELIGQSTSLFHSSRHDRTFFDQIKLSLSECDHWQGEVWSRRKNGESKLHWLNINAVRNNAKQLTHYVSVVSDMSNLWESEQKLHQLTHYDPLTGLANRTLLKIRMEQALNNRSGSDKVAILIIDLDRFKHINDCLGHDAGDQLLLQVAERLSDNISAPDTVARIGGDEFAVLVNTVAHAPDAEQVAKHIVALMEEPFKLNGRHYFTTASIGIALAPEHGDNSDSLLKHADIALYGAKDRGRNNYAFYQRELTRSVEEWVSLEPALREALQNNQLELYYQPQMDGEGQRIVGAEALIRWQHPELGLISPGRFLPIAEEIGLMGKIGSWVLEEACAQLARWQKKGLEADFHLAINLAGAQLDNGDLPAQISGLLKKYQLAPERLELEILETYVMEQEERTVNLLQRLCDLGVNLALDDFGTGYSSLSYLKKLPVHKVKIDRSLVSDLPNDPADEAIICAVISLSHSLNLRVCAEGVETAAQAEFLRQRACDQLQGYLFSKPVASGQFYELLQDTRHFLDIAQHYEVMPTPGDSC
ncbi:sensor domain-containing phosphodiesterase [Marinobacterium jannaschii]|uniref:sensor domain-containing phosphodiesterase n=1 Tax=Marinobacterium jannaschii TaxID=64970 RepID=UPI000687E4E7|nr:EAL domain-containing protein [Marinobacterium jannaschii]